jgi:hypothetical protein
MASDGQANDQLGSSVSVSGDVLAASSGPEDDEGTDTRLLFQEKVWGESGRSHGSAGMKITPIPK